MRKLYLCLLFLLVQGNEYSETIAGIWFRCQKCDDLFIQLAHIEGNERLYLSGDDSVINLNDGGIIGQYSTIRVGNERGAILSFSPWLKCKFIPVQDFDASYTKVRCSHRMYALVPDRTFKIHTYSNHRLTTIYMEKIGGMIGYFTRRFCFA